MPFGSSFCAFPRLFGRCWKGRSPENILEKIKIPYEKHKVRNIGLIERYFHLKSEKSRENLRFNNK